MKIKNMGKIILPFLLISTISKSYAGLHSLTAHSRSNCANNESITWWAGNSFYSRIIAYHNYDGYQKCFIDTGKVLTWRNAAIHWGEAPNIINGKWEVYAYHVLYSSNGVPYTWAVTDVNDCSIYDGWWD